VQLLESIKDPGIAAQARGPWRQALVWDEQNLEDLAPLEAYLQRYPDPDLQPIVTALQAKQQQNIADADKAEAFKALQNKDVAVADARFSAVLRQSPNDVNALVGLGFVRLDQKNFTDALSLFEHAQSLAPGRQDARDGYNNAQFWLDMESGATSQKAQPEAAVVAYQQALTLRPMDSGALLGLANALLQERKFADAEARFQQVLSQDPKNADAMAGLGFVRLNEKKFDDATRLLSQAHTLEPGRTDVDQGYHNAKFWEIMNQAASGLNQNRPRDAVAAYRQALALNPNDGDALTGLANASVRTGDYSTAAETYYRLTTANPNDV
jgi:cellulose synthase operon protein C